MARWLISSLLYVVVFNATSEENRAIHWLYSEMPPAHIIQGEHANTGYADLTLQLLIDSLPEYKHIKIPANYKRSLTELSLRENQCHPALLKTLGSRSVYCLQRAGLHRFGQLLVHSAR